MLTDDNMIGTDFFFNVQSPKNKTTIIINICRNILKPVIAHYLSFLTMILFYRKMVLQVILDFSLDLGLFVLPMLINLKDDVFVHLFAYEYNHDLNWPTLAQQV